MAYKNDFIIERVTNKIIELLENGEVPWRRPWTINGVLPTNLISGVAYRGANAFFLSLSCYNFQSPYFLTFKQVKKLGGSVKKGEHSIPVIYWNWREIKVEKEGEEEEETKKIPFMKSYNVFNVEQCTGISDKVPPLDVKTYDNTSIERCENLIDKIKDKPKIIHGGGRACYNPVNDTIKIPEVKYFESIEEYYSTNFHELVHSTGHRNRLNRFKNKEASFGSTNYSKEELIAEMGATFLCGMCDIENATIDNSAAYIRGWLKRLRNDKKMVVYAAAGAQKAVDFIINKKEVMKNESKNIKRIY